MTSNLLDALRDEVLQNYELQTIVQECEAGTEVHYTVKNGLFYFKNRLRIAFNSTFKTIIL